jgi:hypothetical protein
LRLMKSVTEVQVMVKGTCKCCGSPFQEIVSIATGSSTESPVATPKTLTEAIIGAVSMATGVTQQRILSNDRAPDCSLARHMCVWVLRKYLGLTWPKTAAAVGYSDHTSAIHASQRIQTLVDRFGMSDVGFDWFTQEPCKPKQMNRSKCVKDFGSMYRLLLGT